MALLTTYHPSTDPPVPSTSHNTSTITTADRELLRAASLAAIVNATDLLADAQLLQEHGRHARAVSLSIIGDEELGKSILYVLAALDAVPELKDRLPQQHGPAKNHMVKQVTIEFAVLGFCFASEFQSYINEIGGEFGHADPVWWLCISLRQGEDWVRQELEWMRGKDAGTLDKKTPRPSKRYQDEFSGDVKGRWGPPTLTPEMVKWNGLYVDITGGVAAPSSVDHRAAEAAVAQLTQNISRVVPLRRALEDDDLWLELCKRYPRA